MIAMAIRHEASADGVRVQLALPGSIAIPQGGPPLALNQATSDKKWICRRSPRALIVWQILWWRSRLCCNMHHPWPLPSFG